ncbi:MAG: preprotein translocase subunit SecE [Opitutales bacterium]|nr:preprotein translocase subunit SecE [Opitutales bacterium]
MNPFTKVKQFIIEIVRELKRSSWPSWESLKRSTGIVILTMFLLGSYVSIIDFALFNGMKFITFIAK